MALIATIAVAGCSSSDAESSEPTSPAEATASTANTVAPTTTGTPTPLSIPAPEASTVAELLALDRPVMLAHAGGDFDGPHSTLFAFTEAAIAGIDALEMGVRLSSDGVLVVHHDETVDRTTEASGPVDEFTAEVLAALDNA